MKKIDQKGFSVVELVVVALVIGLIAGLGWWIMNARKDTKSSTTTTTQQSSQQANTNQALEIAALGIKINDPDGRKLQLHAEKICAADCDTEDTQFIRDDNDAYFSKCKYPTAVTTIEGEALEGREKYTKKIGDKYFYATLGSNFQSPCGDESDMAYVEGLRQYVIKNMAAL